MDFFAQQETARKQTLKLVVMLAVAVVAVVGTVDLVVTVGSHFLLDYTPSRDVHLYMAAVVLAAILIFAVRRLIKLRGGGEAVAKMVKARRVKRDTRDFAERQLLNIADEMAIASGVTAPTVYVMDEEEGINAFAAGYSPNEAVVVVTKGSLAKLNREELQAVVGHEFSHILNGDMRLNVRLIGILAGIVIVGEAGLLIVKLCAEAGDSDAIPFALWGLLVAGVGYIGVFFGRMIKAAVSRQREFLADASSIQFTRNPDGLVSALQKIRKDGAVVKSAFAGEMSHMYFGQAISPKFFADLFATHPPIDERIATAQGRRYEAPKETDEEKAQRLARGVVGGLEALFGKSSPDHVERATEMLAAIPAPLRASLDTPEGARRVVYAYLFGGDEATQVAQIKAISAAGDGLRAAGIEDVVATVRKLGPKARLPILTLALSSLKQMEQPARDAFLLGVDGLIEADNEVTLDEFVIRTILRRQLSARAGKIERVKYKDLKQVQADLDIVVAAIARAGGDAEARKTKFSPEVVTGSLDRLRATAPLVKPRVMEACVKQAMADGKLMAAEMEMLRAIGMAIDCPLPPSLEAQEVV
jgi:Zn-dependent protease with chaperone function